MAFQPTQVFEEALPILKVGHVVRAGAGKKGGTGFWVIKRVMIGRKRIIDTSVRSRYKWNQASDTSYNDIVGDVDLNRIVHLRYIACEQTVDTIMYWGKDPLMSKDVEDVINSYVAPEGSPLKLDKWSYDQSQFLAITKVITEQDFVIEFINYELVPSPEYTDLKPPKRYLSVTAEGNATYIER